MSRFPSSARVGIISRSSSSRWGEKDIGQSGQRGGECFSRTGEAGAEVPGCILDSRNGRFDSAVICIHPLHQIGCAGIAPGDERVETAVLGFVMVVQKIHHPQHMIGQGCVTGLLYP